MTNDKDKQANAGVGQTPPSSAPNEAPQEASATFSVRLTPSEAAAQPAENTAEAEAPAQPADNTAEAETPAQPAENTAEAEAPAQPADNTAEAEAPAQPADNTAEPETPAQPAENTAEAEASAQMPVPAKRRQHYFTNLPTIGLEAEPLTAPWETDHPQGDTAQEDDDADDEKTARSDKITMIIAVSSAVIIAVAVLGFISYMLLSTADFGKHTDPLRKASADSATRPTLSTVAVETTKAGDPAKTVVMPNLNGLKEAEAYRRLNAAEVRYRVVRVNDDEVPFNYIVSQNPNPGQEFASTEEAVIYLSKGKENERIESSTHAAVVRPTNAATAPTGTAATGATASAASGDYILPDSANKQLTKSDLAGLNRETLNLALNEIYARHGRKFTDAAISSYFNAKSWYRPTIAANDFDDGILNQYEQYNLKLITNYQTEMGYR